MFHVEPNSKKRLLASPKDHLVSGESFRVMLDRSTQIAQTSPFPSLEQLPAYYQHQAYISHGNANRSVVERMYGFVQGLMFWQKGKWLKPYFSKESTYLDYGCGTASFVNHLNRIGIDAYGVEPSKKARTFHKETKKVVATLNEIEKKKLFCDSSLACVGTYSRTQYNSSAVIQETFPLRGADHCPAKFQFQRRPIVQK